MRVQVRICPSCGHDEHYPHMEDCPAEAAAIAALEAAAKECEHLLGPLEMVERRQANNFLLAAAAAIRALKEEG